MSQIQDKNNFKNENNNNVKNIHYGTQHCCKWHCLITARLRRDLNEIITSIQTFNETKASYGRQSVAINQ